MYSVYTMYVHMYPYSIRTVRLNKNKNMHFSKVNNKNL